MTKKSYQSKRPLRRKIQETVKEYAPKAKAAFFAGLAFAKKVNGARRKFERKNRKAKRRRTKKKKCR